ncbi:MAG: hypothetical protein WD767_13320 [Alphaproteobacteria bacterium]
MVQSVGFDPLQVSFSSADQRRPSEREPDSTRITPATENEAATADRRQRDTADTSRPLPELTRIAFTAKFGPDANGQPLQLIRGEQVAAAEEIDLQAIAANRVPQEERQPVLLQAQESRVSATDATRRQQEADADRQRETETAVGAERQETARVEQQQDNATAQSGERRPSAGSFLDLRV